MLWKQRAVCEVSRTMSWWGLLTAHEKAFCHCLVAETSWQLAALIAGCGSMTPARTWWIQWDPTRFTLTCLSSRRGGPRHERKKVTQQKHHLMLAAARRRTCRACRALRHPAPFWALKVANRCQPELVFVNKTDTIQYHNMKYCLSTNRQSQLTGSLQTFLPWMLYCYIISYMTDWNLLAKWIMLLEWL